MPENLDIDSKQLLMRVPYLKSNDCPIASWNCGLLLTGWSYALTHSRPLAKFVLRRSLVRLCRRLCWPMHRSTLLRML